MEAYYGLLLMLVAGTIHAQDICLSDYYKKECLKDTQVSSWQLSYMVGGNPCFVYNSKRWCFVSTTGSMHPCSCTPECGCGDSLPPPPTCDNTEKPQTFDCGGDWCTTYGQTHSMCRYCPQIGDACEDICQYGLNEDEKGRIVAEHNRLRAIVAAGNETRGVGGAQPKASNMNMLVWDDELAKVAQAWVQQCLGGHDDGADRKTPTYSWVGQNYAMSGRTQLDMEQNDLESMIKRWYDEVKDFPPQNVKPFTTSGSTGVVGHYTQVAWASTKKVGCGFIQFKQSDSKYYTRHFTCNYGPGGNMGGDAMYEIGEPGSACTNGVENGLCKP